VVGSYRESDQHIIVNVYLLNAASGRPEPGCAGSVEGSSKELLSLTSNLARQIHDRVSERVPNWRVTWAWGARHSLPCSAPRRP
jgi:hypothetical protein